jgi:two-component system NtrC family sensor kinase
VVAERRERKILVVDDDWQIREMLPPVLAQYGYCSVAVDTAEKAVEELREGSAGIDVVLTDVKMPAISGIELLERIHRLIPEMPVILMSAYTDLEMVEVAIRKKAFDFIAKPLDFSELAMTLEKAVRHVTLLEMERNYRQTLEEMVEKKTRELRCRHEELQTLFRQVEAIKREWERTMDCVGDIIILCDADGRIRRCNQALRDFCALSYQEIVGRNWCAFLAGHGLHLPTPCAQATELFHEPSGRWFNANAYPFAGADDAAAAGLVVTIVDTSELKHTVEKLAHAYGELQATQAQMLQREKMASIGQLAAGVAHEINNPMGVISSNLATLGKYVERLSVFIGRQTALCAPGVTPAVQAELEQARRELKVDHILQDIAPLIAESLDGAGRVRTIVQNLKGFSRPDEGECRVADILECLESAVNIVWNELKYKAILHRNYGELPPVRCYPQQLNQVFMNLLVNAAHAIENQGEVTIDARLENGAVLIAISDTGCGIPPEQIGRIFEPFFTTKEVGKGTGLGLSISYDIVKKHNGEISVQSVPGEGTTFTVMIPVA